MVKSFCEEGKQFFESYTEKLIKAKDYDIAENLRLKKEHSLRVAKLSQAIAEKIELDEVECGLAYTIGLLHDIGRFPQYDKYKTFVDEKSEDHAALSVEIIKEQAFFVDLPEAEQNVILSAINEHNKISIDTKDKQALLFGQVLRDADKLDIWEIAVSNLKRDGSFNIPSISFNLPTHPNVSDGVLKTMLSGKSVMKKDLKSVNDYKVLLMSMVFDLNFKASFHILSEKQYIKKIYDTLPKRDDVIEAYRKIRLFIENKFVE